MIARFIEVCLRNRLLVLAFFLLIVLAGIRAGDVIVAVDDIPLSATGTRVENRTAAVNRIKGREGTKVKLTIRRPNVPFPINRVMERQPIQNSPSAFVTTT